VALAVFAAVQHGPAIRGAFVRFEPGDALVDVHSGRPFGEVARYDDSHAFPNGRSARAYLVELEDGAEKWYPAQDLERNCATR